MWNPAPLITNTALRVPCRLSRHMFNKFAVHFPTLFSAGSIGCDESISSQVQHCRKQTWGKKKKNHKQKQQRQKQGEFIRTIINEHNTHYSIKTKAKFSTTMEVMKHRKASTTLGLNLEFRHQNNAIILTVSPSFPSKIVIGTLLLYLEQQQDTKGESTKTYKALYFFS